MRGGLVAFKPNPSAAHWAHWRTWPHLSVAMDLGSDGLCAFDWREYGPHKLNVDKYPYPSHGANRCVISALLECELFTLALVMLISWNL
ncbi:MAG: hypothetical protein ACKPKO_27360, partial [Candidatus Fonsibacter sp.]